MIYLHKHAHPLGWRECECKNFKNNLLLGEIVEARIVRIPDYENHKNYLLATALVKVGEELMRGAAPNDCGLIVTRHIVVVYEWPSISRF